MPWTEAIVWAGDAAPGDAVEVQSVTNHGPVLGAKKGGPGDGKEGLPVDITDTRIDFTLPAKTAIYRLTCGIYTPYVGESGNLQLACEGTSLSSEWTYLFDGKHVSSHDPPVHTPPGSIFLLTGQSGVVVTLDVLLYASFPPTEEEYSAELYIAWSGSVVWGDFGPLAGSGWIGQGWQGEGPGLEPFQLGLYDSNEAQWGPPNGAWATLQDLNVSGLHTVFTPMARKLEQQKRKQWLAPHRSR